MKKKERERLKLVVYEAYMAGQATGQKTEGILEEVAQKYHRNARTIQNWIYDVRRQRKALESLPLVVQHLREQVRIVASGDFYVDEDTGEARQPEPISHLSLDGETLLV